MGGLYVSMLGSPELTWAGQPLNVASRKSLALLCLLALREAPLSRVDAAGMFWDGGLANVRQALYQLRQLPGADEWLDAGTDLTVRAITDVGLLRERVREGSFREALELWRGPFLQGLELPDAAEVEAYFTEAGARVERLLRTALAGRSRVLEAEGDLPGVLEVIDRQLELDPFDEEALRQALRLEFLLERPAVAAQRFRNWRDRLAAELGAEPSPATLELVEAIAAGVLPGGDSGPGAGLPPVLEQLLAALSLARGDLSVEQIAAVLRRDGFEVSEGIERLRHAGLLGQGLDVRPEVSVSLSPTGRQLLEGRMAEVLEGTEPGDWTVKARLGRHWLEAWQPQRAAPWLLEAAVAALTASEIASAVRLAFLAAWTGDERQRFRAMMVLEGVGERKGDDSLQNAALNEAAELAWSLQDDAALCRVHMARARAFARRSQNSLAHEHADEAIAIARRVGDPELLATAFNCMGVTSFTAGDLTSAQAAFREAADLHVEGESLRALSNLGALCGMRDDHAEAYRLFDEALTLARRSGDLLTVTACLNNLSASAERSGAYERAARHLHEGRQLTRRLGHRGMEAQIIQNLAVIYTRQGALGPAWNTSREVIEEGEQTADLALQAQGYEQAADVAARCGDSAEQAKQLGRAGELLTQLGDRRRLASHAAAVALARSFRPGIPPEFTAVRELGLSSHYSWLLLELALKADSRAAGQELLAAGSWHGPHQEFVADVARARLLLLEPGAADQAEISALRASVTLGLETSEYVEAPLACHLLALLEHLQGEDGSDLIRRRDALLVEQGRGLPRSLRTSLQRLPDSWPGFSARPGPQRG